MKPCAVLINASRGALVDEAALLAALEGGHLSAAWLDEFEEEPPKPDHPLFRLDNVIVTPHVASMTRTALDSMWRGAIAQALQVLQGERPPNMVNPEVWDRRRS